MKKELKIIGLFSLLFITAITLTSCDKKENEDNIETKEEIKTTNFGWYEVEIPEGYSVDKYGLEFKNEENDSTVIKVMLEKRTFRNAKEAALKENDYTDHEFTGEIELGDYTWYKVTFPWNGGKESVKYFADVNDNYYVAVDTFMLAQGDETAESFIKSIKIVDGDLSKLKSDYARKQK